MILHDGVFIACLALVATAQAPTAEPESVSEVQSEDKPDPGPTPAWVEFEAAHAEGKTARLPDFSYAGYRRSEEPIPDVAYPELLVTDFGAVPNDDKSDRDAIQQAFDEAAKRAPAVVRFPAGRFLLGVVDGAPVEPLTLRASHVVLRGNGAEGEEATELYVPTNLKARDRYQLWSTPFVFQLGGESKRTELTSVTTGATRETHAVVVADASGLEAGDWIALRSRNPEANGYYVAPKVPEPEWTRMHDSGVEIIERHRVRAVDEQRVTFCEPLRVDIDPVHGWKLYALEPAEGIGVEDIAFVGGWVEKFRHHRSAVHDGGWSLLALHDCVDSWIRRCRFTDTNRPWVLRRCANFSVLDSYTDGYMGHSATGLAECTNCLVAFYEDRASHWHGPGVQARSSGTVLHRVRWNPDTSFEAHASYPIATLFDRCRGGLRYGRWGGDSRALPNHLRYLVFWNFEQIGRPVKKYCFWLPKESGVHGRVLPPILVGWFGQASEGTSFDLENVELLEGYGAEVSPASLWEAQLERRLGAMPTWLNER